MTTLMDWQVRLHELAALFPQYCADNDVAVLSPADQWGLYRFLTRLAKGK